MSKTSLFGAADELAMVVGQELAEAFVKMRRAIKKPITEDGARFMANRLRKFADPMGSVEQSVRNSWLDCYEVKPDRQQSYGSTRGLEHFARAIQDEESSNASHRQISPNADDRNAAGGLPLLVRH